MKRGIVCLIGRPNVGKSTLLNNLLGRKVSITSPKPQTTRFAIQAVYEDDRGQIVFIDTPGIFGKAQDWMSKRINQNAEEAFGLQTDLVVYIVDHTRNRDFEENKTLGIVRKMNAPKILVVNKSDVIKPSHREQYLFLRDEFDTVLEISALKNRNLNKLIDTIFTYLPEGEPLVDTKEMVQPGINLDSKTFIAEIIREKAYLNLRKELPYAITTVIDEVTERENGVLFIKARLLTAADRYKSMIVGNKGSMIREISMAARKELEVASDKKIFLELTVETDTHWMDYL